MQKCIRLVVQPRNPPHIPEPLPWWYKSDLRSAFHQGATGHDIENRYPLKYEFRKIVKSGMVSFKDRAPNVKANPLPAHGNSSVNIVDGCPSANFKNLERVVIQYDNSNSNHINQRSVSPLVIWLAGLVPYSSDKVFPKDKEESIVIKKMEVSAVDPTSASKCQSGESINLKANDDDEVLRLIKSEFNMVEQLLQIP
ncbi:hypothetical protein KIW84_023564 [Lathyrus oleraceus]|uniref:Uncharacterized protein n=1 Tax=Pisum sativum TaxID=3888 RepID=A0A9D5BBC9_PEA|nr:hypothetical protein KIW84_023564 [Pisum sativum]